MASSATYRAHANARLGRAQILLVGDTAVGKSCLLMRFTTDTFEEETTSTIGAAPLFNTICDRSHWLRTSPWKSFIKFF